MQTIQLFRAEDLTEVSSQNDGNLQEEYSAWINQGKDYFPAQRMRLRKSLPSGAYRVEYIPNSGEYSFIPATINTDEIYQFSQDLTETIIKEVQDFWDRAEIYKQHNLLHKRGLLLEGPAGNSKTSTITLLIERLLKNDGLIFLVNNPRDFQNTYYALSNIVRQIEPSRPIITVIEDIDQLIANLGTDSDVLDFLDGKHAINHHLIIMTSNNTSELSEAMLRPSRIDMRFVLEVPSKEVRKAFLEKKGVSAEVSEEYAVKTEGMSFAQLKEVFISTVILGKDIDYTVNKIFHPMESKDYLSSTQSKIGL